MALQVLRHVVPVVFGMGGGALVVSFATKTAPTEKPAPSAAVAAVSPTVQYYVLPQQVSDAGAAAPQGTIAVPEPSAGAEPGPTPEEWKAHHERQHADAIAAHAAEARDGPWASAASRSLEGELVRIGNQQGFRVIEVDCRTTTCKGVVEWPSMDEAKKGFRSVLTGIYEPRCGTRILLHEAADPNARYQEAVIFDCERE